MSNENAISVDLYLAFISRNTASGYLASINITIIK